MRRLASLLVLGIIAVAASPAAAQRGPGGKGPGGPGGRGFERPAPERQAPSGPGADIQKLRADLEKLMADIKTLESHLKQGKEQGPMPRTKGEAPPAAKGHEEARRPTPPSFGPGGPPWGGFGRGGFGPPSGWGRPGGFTPPSTAKGGESKGSSAPSVEKRLDKLESDIEEIKRLLRSRK